MNLEQSRKAIDEIDQQLVKLFSERMACAAEIAAYKKENNLPVLDAGRERQKLAAISEMAPDDLENVKVKFFKGKGAVRGSGIGLAVVDEIVTALDGSVDIQSEVGRGTTVTVRLPLYKRPAPSGAPPRGGTAGV